MKKLTLNAETRELQLELERSSKHFHVGGADEQVVLLSLGDVNRIVWVIAYTTNVHVYWDAPIQDDVTGKWSSKTGCQYLNRNAFGRLTGLWPETGEMVAVALNAKVACSVGRPIEVESWI